MATQLKHTDFAYTPARQNITVAVIAGDAAIAVNDAKLPDGTLEQLSIRSDTEALIVEARKLLSPRMYDAFLRWGEAAVRANMRSASDDDAFLQTSSACDQVRRVGATDAQNAHDVFFKSYLMALEAADCPATGPLRLDPNHASGYAIEGVILGLSGDLAFYSPVCRMVDDLSERAWQLSESRSVMTAEIGDAMIAAYRDARAGIPIPSTMDGYHASMRGPRIQWEAAYARYTEAADALAAYDCDVHTPISERYLPLSGQVHGGATDPNVLADYAQAEAELDVAQDRFDDLVDAKFTLLNRLLVLPAPGPSELAIKLRLYSDGYEWGGGEDARAGGAQITIDARRFARHGAHLQTDADLLQAYADRRRVFEGTPRSAVTTSAEDDAYFAAIDASEDVMVKTNATTIEGALAKLRVAFMSQTGEAWSDLAIADPTGPTFRDGLAASGVYTRLAWSAIEDLARIGGVSLSEQGR